MKKAYFIYLHIGYWLILWLKEFLFGFQTYNLNDLSFATVVSTLSVKLIVLFFPVCIFYTSFLLLVPKLVRTKKIVLYIISLFVLFSLLAPIHKYVYATLLPQKFGWYSYVYIDKLNFWLSFQTLLFENYVYIFFSIAISYVDEYFETQKKQQELEKEQAITELAYLKSQINPHFLFNTLNDIYSLTYQKAEMAPEAVLKLSELLRYMLKESNDRFASVEREIAYLKNVVELYEIGQKGIAYINLEINGDYKDREIAPLILINFIENAFKHGIVNDPENPVRIKLSINENDFDFEVFNKKNKDYKDKTGGIGLANVQRRLTLIYPDRHEISIIDENDTFTVHLNIKNI
ncbi:sensor histidine kinase [Pedobacter miscanthi]|uniref:Histidine kinase n=1 Tax=Pedobacter miscanthi TaxID=2259170 RepID=A0A366KUI2_9SPHI|nr:histidine kinase [Pedobacter miscanthi]RBQ04512.1 histidine kinase [Pedobacter miscanthi]